MLVPSLFNNDFVDDFFNDYFDYKPAKFHATGNSLMAADVKEFKDHFELDMELPGFSKENLGVSLKEGYLTVTAERTEKRPADGEESGKYIRRERYTGKVERSFYVGEEVKTEDIKAKFNNGILAISIPKVEPKKAEDLVKHITIA